MSGDSSGWIKGDLTIDRGVLDGIHQHALETYPSECCGFASGPASEVGAVNAAVRETNEADKYHKLDPITFPRTSTTYFKINELRAAKAFDQGEKNGQPIKVIYHSHCDAGAYFSQEDAATFASDNLLMWPCAFIVVSVMKDQATQQGKVMDTKLWVHVPGTNGFAESRLTVR